MFDNYDEIRIALLGAGFIPVDRCGQVYTRLDEDKEFTVNFPTRTMTAVYPDKEYNSRNPYSHKNNESYYKWKESDTNLLILECMKKFANDICEQK